MTLSRGRLGYLAVTFGLLAGGSAVVLATAPDRRACWLAGGVAANRLLRKRLGEGCRTRGWHFAVPPLQYCGDNGAMVALAGALRLAAGERSDWRLGAIPTLHRTRFGA